MDKTLQALRVLKVEPSKSTFREITSAYRLAAKLLHPDVPGTGNDLKFREVIEAFNHLKSIASGNVDVPLVEKRGPGMMEVVFNKEAFKHRKETGERYVSDAAVFQARMRMYESRRFNFQEWERMHYYAPSDFHRNARKSEQKPWRDWDNTPLNRHQEFFRRKNAAATHDQQWKQSSSWNDDDERKRSSSTSSSSSTNNTGKRDDDGVGR